VIEHNAITRGGSLSKAAAFASGLGEDEAGLTRLGETLTPVLDLWQQPEWALLRDELLAFGGSGLTGGVAVNNIQLFNPVGSNVLVITELIQAVSAIAEDVQLLLNDAALLTDTNRAGSRDTRNHPTLGFNLGVRGQIRQEQTAALPGNAGLVYVQSAGRTEAEIRYEVPFVLAPGHGLVLRSLTVGGAIDANFSWRERRPLPRELRGI